MPFLVSQITGLWLAMCYQAFGTMSSMQQEYKTWIFLFKPEFLTLFSEKKHAIALG
jgi:hypothetical protein